MYQITRKDDGLSIRVSAATLMSVCATMSEDGKRPLDVATIADDAPLTHDAAPVTGDEPTATGMPEVPCPACDPKCLADRTIAVHSCGKDATADTVPAPEAPVFSSFGSGLQVTDDDAKARIDAQHVALRAAGVEGIGYQGDNGNTDGQQLYANGTRMAAEGYARMSSLQAEHEASRPVRDLAADMVQRIYAEGREDVVCTARDVARSVEVNGAIRVQGFKMSEQAIRGLCLRLESPSLRYLLGLRDRIAVEGGKPEETRDHARIQADKRKIAEIIVHECDMNPDATLQLRTRKGPGDIFAIVSPGYVPADMPSALAPIVDALPRDARGEVTYDAHTTAWELRANVWTPTAVAKMAVGEAFKAYASFKSRDNGTSSFTGGGGIELIRCLNASTYEADTARMSRRHMGRILTDVEAMIEGAMNAIKVMAAAWGTARTDVVEAPSGVTIEQAIPGFYRYMLTDRRQLAGILPGRTEAHVNALATAFTSERRDASKLVRADLANGFTKYIQRQPADVRRDAESAIGAWVVKAPPVRYVAREANA